MPFRVNVGPYVGGQLLASGISQLGQGIGSGIKNAIEMYNEEKESDATSNVIYDRYLKTLKGPDGKPIDPNEVAKRKSEFLHMRPRERKGMVAGIVQGYLDDYRQEQLTNLQQNVAESKARMEALDVSRKYGGTEHFMYDPTSQQSIATGFFEPGTGQYHPYQSIFAPKRKDPRAGEIIWHPTSGQAIGMRGDDGDIKYFNEAAMKPVATGFEPTEEMRKAAKAGGYDYFKTDKGWELKSLQQQKGQVTGEWKKDPKMNWYYQDKADGGRNYATPPMQLELEAREGQPAPAAGASPTPPPPVTQAAGFDQPNALNRILGAIGFGAPFGVSGPAARPTATPTATPRPTATPDEGVGGGGEQEEGGVPAAARGSGKREGKVYMTDGKTSGWVKEELKASAEAQGWYVTIPPPGEQ